MTQQTTQTEKKRARKKLFVKISLTGILAFLVAFYALPPNLSLLEIKDKNNYNIESVLVFKNIGNLPAYNVVPHVSGMKFNVWEKNFISKDYSMDNIPKISAGEETPIPILVGNELPVGTNVQSCNYVLTMKYQFHLPFYTKELSKKWKVELRDSGDSFVWQFKML